MRSHSEENQKVIYKFNRIFNIVIGRYPRNVHSTYYHCKFDKYDIRVKYNSDCSDKHLIIYEYNHQKVLDLRVRPYMLCIDIQSGDLSVLDDVLELLRKRRVWLNNCNLNQQDIKVVAAAMKMALKEGFYDKPAGLGTDAVYELLDKLSLPEDLEDTSWSEWDNSLQTEYFE